MHGEVILCGFFVLEMASLDMGRVIFNEMTLRSIRCNLPAHMSWHVTVLDPEIWTDATNLVRDVPTSSNF